MAKVAIRREQFERAKSLFGEMLGDGNLDWYIGVLAETVDFLLAIDQPEAARATAYIVWLHPAAARSYHDNLEKHLDYYGLQVDQFDQHPAIEDKISFITEHIPLLAQTLDIPTTFFEARLDEIISSQT